MKFGASTYFLKERTVTESLSVIARLGYGTAEIWMEHYGSARQRPSTISRHARSLGLDLTVHAASYDLNIISTNAGIRRESQRQIRSSIAVAASLEAKGVVVHPGALSSPRDDRASAWGCLEETVSLLDEWANGYGLWVGVENMEKGAKEIFTLPQDLARVFERRLRHIRLTLDLAHMQTHMDPLSFLRQLHPGWICHVHLSDNNPASTHLPLGRGQLPVVHLLETLQTFYDGIISLEGYLPGQGEELLRHNMSYLRDNGFAQTGEARRWKHGWE